MPPPPPPASTDAVVSITNHSSYTVGFDFRWTPSSPWTLYTEAPGQTEIFSTTYSSGLTPQAYFDPTTTAGNDTLVTLAQGYGEWTGTGTPPSSPATPYGFENVTNGLELFFIGGSAAPAPNPNAVISPNWSGYVAATNLTSPQPNSVTEVVGSWIVPAVTGPAGANTDSSVWVGIDGYGSGTVEQVGTQEDARKRQARLSRMVGDVLDRERTARAAHRSDDDLARRLDDRRGPVHRLGCPCGPVLPVYRGQQPGERLVRHLCHLGPVPEPARPAKRCRMDRRGPHDSGTRHCESREFRQHDILQLFGRDQWRLGPDQQLKLAVSRRWTSDPAQSFRTSRRIS